MSRLAVVVEDDRHIGALVEFALEPLGLRVERFTDGEGALARLRATPRPTVVILDLMLPCLSGREVLAALDDEPALARVPVLVLSARQSPGDLGRRAGGPLAFLAKPFDVDHLLRVVEGLLA